MAMAQPGKGAPSALFGQELGEQVERMHRGQQCQQMGAPELSRTELPVWATHGPGVPAFVDEVVGNERIQQFEQLAGAGHREAVHGRRGYRL